MNPTYPLGRRLLVSFFLFTPTKNESKQELLTIIYETLITFLEFFNGWKLNISIHFARYCSVQKVTETMSWRPVDEESLQTLTLQSTFLKYEGLIDNDEVLFCHFSKRLNTTLLMSYSTAGANFSNVRNKMSLLDKCRYMQLCLFDRQTKFKPLLVKKEIVGRQQKWCAAWV